MIIIYRINSYKFGEIVVNDKTYQNDLIIYPDKIKDNWWRRDGHRLYINDIEDIKNYDIDMLIIGTGASGRMNVDTKLKEYLDENDIEYYIGNTSEAVKKHNLTSKNKKAIITALHLTC